MEHGVFIQLFLESLVKNPGFRRYGFKQWRGGCETTHAVARTYTPVTAARTTLSPAAAVKLEASLSSGMSSATPSVRIADTWLSATEMSPVGLGAPVAESTQRRGTPRPTLG